jgi:hypothetical protein
MLNVTLTIAEYLVTQDRNDVASEKCAPTDYLTYPKTLSGSRQSFNAYG